MSRFRVPYTFLLLCIMACSTQETPHREAAAITQEKQKTNSSAKETLPLLQNGFWQASLTVPGGELPFLFEISDIDTAPKAFLQNASERVLVQNVTLIKDTLTLNLPAFNSTIQAKIIKNDALKGSLTLTKRDGIEQNIPFQATWIETIKNAEKTPSSINLTGLWEVGFTDDDGNQSQAIGKFTQKGSSLTGTFLTPTGDYRYLSGKVDGQDFYLSCFDGAHAFLFKATLTKEGTIKGDFWSGTKWHESWTAVKNPDITLPDAETLTYLNKGYDTVEFTFPDLNGNEISITDPRFKDKVLIITLAGSWCPNCHDEAAFLSKFYQEYKDQGLEIVGLMYEHFTDFEKASKQVRHFQQKHQIEFPLLIAGYSDKKEAAKTMPMLNHVMSYPTMIFIDRTGKVRKIHTGFSGPGTGEYYEKFQSEFTSFVKELLET